MNTAIPVSGRACGGCTLCCDLLYVAELEKPREMLCKHCELGVGCKIYPERPAECRDFLCGYRASGEISDAWLPTKCRMVVVLRPDSNSVEVHVDRKYPDVWRADPFHSDIREWAKEVLSDGRLEVWIGERRFVVFPDRDVEIGEVSVDEEILISRQYDRDRNMKIFACKRKIGDPLPAQDQWK